jgi:hypothetical protein
MHKTLLVSLLLVVLLSACGRTTGSTGPSLDLQVVQVGLHLNSDGEFVLDGSVSVPLTPIIPVPGLQWDVAFETVLNETKNTKTNYLVILWQEPDGQVYEQDYPIGQPFKITFEHDQWVRDISHDTASGNIVVFVEKQKLAAQPLSQNPTPLPVPTMPQDQPTNSPAKTAQITCANDITEVSLRKTAGYLNKNDDTDRLAKVPCGEIVTLLGETANKDQLTWWHVSWNGLTGWMADHTSNGREILIFNNP